MSNLPGNPHYEPTLESISDFGEYTISAEGLTDATIIWQGLADQVQATLALAYEQRTANLIALVNGPTNIELPENEYREALRQVKTRLGLGDTK